MKFIYFFFFLVFQSVLLYSFYWLKIFSHFSTGTIPIKKAPYINCFPLIMDFLSEELLYEILIFNELILFVRIYTL